MCSARLLLRSYDYYTLSLDVILSRNVCQWVITLICGMEMYYKHVTFIVHIYICKVAICTTNYIVYGCTQCVIAQVSATSLSFILGYVVRRLVIIIIIQQSQSCCPPMECSYSLAMLFTIFLQHIQWSGRFSCSGC